MTGRYAIRSGNHTVQFPGSPGGLVAWERTQGDVFSEAGYATMCLGKWHIGNEDGRWPTDHGFDEWYGPVGSYDEAFWAEDPWYDPGRDPVPYLQDARKGAPPERGPRLTKDVKLTWMWNSSAAPSASWTRMPGPAARFSCTTTTR